ncbi:hypothetical protein PQE73_gp229 [Bacillus phage vB_BanS_MrDarsey]|uniref:Uncharacterized protein n=1 Tax=Bacillus phage vB_BanS_MrDarsey TaxID=2894787 RepID=A0AAE8YQH7_9CAUD|nr:hypothetical protein PQE73_gp229 [Bacillus phage vB_BanS_MrDarsey]UGO48070.1 hypothetical protein MRDARSEY_258 [Bacillus phage vB_BanS_MrDarsey]
MSNLFESLVFDTKQKKLGGIVEVSFLKNTYTLETEQDGKVVNITTKIEDAIVLSELGHMGGEVIFEGDVFVSKAQEPVKYEIEKLEDGTLVLHKLNKRLEREKSGEPFTPEKLSDFAPYLELFGNIYALQSQRPQVDFNIRVVRQVINGEVSYAYACNNKLEESVDLLAVVFVGHQLLEEEDYTRITLPYEGYLESIERGVIKEVNPQELANYVTGKAMGRNPEISVEGLILDQEGLRIQADGKNIAITTSNVAEPTEKVAVDKCKCGQDTKVCDCNLWKY